MSSPSSFRRILRSRVLRRCAPLLASSLGLGLVSCLIAPGIVPALAQVPVRVFEKAHSSAPGFTFDTSIDDTVWDKGTPISGGEITNTVPANGIIEVPTGSSIRLTLSEATDNDHYTRAAGPGIAADTIKYTWTSSGGGLSANDASASTWNAPELEEGVTLPDFTVTVVIDDLPNPIAANQSGNRDDDSIERSFTLRVVPQKTWEVGDAIEGGDVAPPPNGAQFLVGENEAVSLQLSPVTDSDKWTQGTKEGTDNDDITYYWYCDMGGSFSSPESSAPTWTAPELPEGVGSQPYTLTCIINDAPKVIPNDESGNRDDDYVTKSVIVNVTQKIWDVGDDIQGGDSITTSAGNGPYLFVDQGQTVTLTMAQASDTDHWQHETAQGTLEGTEDDEIHYKWTLGGFGQLSSTEGQTVTWTAPQIPGDFDSIGGTQISCEADDAPGEIEDTATGYRDDAAKRPSEPIIIFVVRKKWTADPGISGGELQGPAENTKFSPGETVGFTVGDAIDSDSWFKLGTIGEGELDNTLTYTWSASRGGFATSDANGQPTIASTVTGQSANWVVPPASDEVPATITCTINDGEGPRVDFPNEVGTKDDDPVTRTLTVKIVPSKWSPTDKEIGYHPLRDAQGNFVRNGNGGTADYIWVEDGRLLAPLDQTAANPATHKDVDPGEEVPCEIEEAQDWDTLVKAKETTVEQDGPLTYTWTASAGHFKVTHPDGTQTNEASFSGTSAAAKQTTWVAPDDLTQTTDVTVKCTVSDPSGARVTEPELGSHDDATEDHLVRTIPITVKVPVINSGESKVAWHIFPHGEDEAWLGKTWDVEKPVEGTLDLQFAITVGAQSKIHPGADKVRVRVKKKTQNGEPALEGNEDHVDYILDLNATNWKKYEGTYVPQGEPAVPLVDLPDASPKEANTTNEHSYIYLKTAVAWNTTQPLTNDPDGAGPLPSTSLPYTPGEYVLSLVEVIGHNGELAQYEGDTLSFPLLPDANTGAAPKMPFCRQMSYKVWGADNQTMENVTLVKVFSAKWYADSAISGGEWVAPADDSRVGPGGRLSFSISEAIDQDLKESDKNGDGIISSNEKDLETDPIKSYTWTCSAGKFVTTGSDGKEQLVDTVSNEAALNVTWIAWMTPGSAEISCEIEDEGGPVSEGQSGTRKDENLIRERNVEVVEVKLQGRRMQSPEEITSNMWSDDEQNAATIAAGGVDSPEQKAEVRIVYNDALVTFPVGQIILNVDEAKGEGGPNGVLTMNGAEGEYKSSNVMDSLVHLKLEAGPGSKEIGICQFWGDQSEWNVAPEFIYGQEYPLSFTPFVADNVKIKGQQVTLAPHKIIFYSWDEEEGDFIAYTFTPTSTTPEKWGRVSSNIQIIPGTITSTNGTYAAQFKVTYDDQRMIDQIQFSAIGENIYKP